MPIDEYFKGHGEDVMDSMVKKNGSEGKREFYATANKTGMKPGEKGNKKPPSFRKYKSAKGA